MHCPSVILALTRSLVLLGLAAAAEAFRYDDVLMGLTFELHDYLCHLTLICIRCSPAGLPGLRAPGTGLRAQCDARRTATYVAPKMQSNDDPNIIFDAGQSFKSESQKMREATSGMQVL